MRIGVDVGRVLHGDGGVAVYTRGLVKALAAHDGGLEILLFDLDRGVHNRRVFEAAFGGLPEQLAIGAASNDLRELDVFHAPGFRMPPIGAPSHVFTLHDLTALSHPQFHKLDNRIRSLTSTSEALARGATILAVSQATGEEAVRLLAIPQEQIEVVPPIVGEHFTAQSKFSSDKEYLERIGVDGPYALAVASLEPRKNFSRLLDAWDELPSDLREAHQLVVVVSAHWLQSAVRRRLAKMGRSGSVLLLDHVPASELAALYRGARTLVFPSLAEGFGLPVAEAMACGTPVVTSDRSSMPEVADGGAMLVDPEDVSGIADGIERVLADQSLRRDLRERGFESASRFTAEVVVPKLVEVYGRAAKRSQVGLRHG